METTESEKVNENIVRNLGAVITIVSFLSALPHRPLEALPILLLTCATLMIVFFPAFKLVERVKVEGVRVGNWTAYRLYPIYFIISVASIVLVSILLLIVFVNQICLLYKLI
jgi:hypothetical protein